MVMSALDSFMTKVSWAPLDILVIDMPPGTGTATKSVLFLQACIDAAVSVMCVHNTRPV